jgi:hypothetical protein
MTPFYHAYINSRWDSTIPILLARGANINSRVRASNDRRDRHGQTFRHNATPLGEACRLGRFEDAMKLIDLGADVNSGIRLERRSAVDIPPLLLCCMDFSRDDEFFPAGKAIWSRAPAQRASRGAAIARLVAAGVSPDEKLGFGGRRKETALSVAVRHINVAAVEALLAAGADVQATDLLGRNALMVSVERPTSESPTELSLAYLSNGSTYPGSPCTAHPDRWDIAKLLIDAGISSPMGTKMATPFCISSSSAFTALIVGSKRAPTHVFCSSCSLEAPTLACATSKAFPPCISLFKIDVRPPFSA